MISADLSRPHFPRTLMGGSAFCLLLILNSALGDTVTGTGSGWNWTVNLPSAPAPNSTVSVTLMGVVDADQQNEGLMHIGPTYTLPLFGTQGVPGNDAQPPTNAPPRNLLPYSTPASAWAQGPNAVGFTWNNPSPAYHNIGGLSVSYTPLNSWLTLATTLQANRWVPPWLSSDDQITVYIRDDIEPGRLLACVTDTSTNARFVTWVPQLQTSIPTGPAPPATACMTAWCSASGSTREAQIDAACP